MSTVKKLFVSHVSNKAEHCDSFSNCLLDPNSWMSTVVIRILWFVLKFITWKEDQGNCQMMININQKLTYKEAEAPQRNFFFAKSNHWSQTVYQNIPVSAHIHRKNGILYYSGWILPTEKIQAASKMTEVMKDLCSNTFCVPLVYKHSPLAHNIGNEIHWHSAVAKHSGN